MTCVADLYRRTMLWEDAAYIFTRVAVVCASHKCHNERVRRIIILGSTGSIGRQTLDIVRANRDRFQVVGLAANLNREQMQQQATEFGVEHVAIGADASEQMARSVDADVVLNAITGSVGLGATIAALEAGRVLALANKESLIVGGELVTSISSPGRIIPVDSEHSAIAQALLGEKTSEIGRLILTASGGPLRGWSRELLKNVTPAQALAHPTWNMGVVVTTNSATLVNKGLEIIEAHLLFDVPYDQIIVTVHPQSIIHSLVEFVDGSTIAQASPPDMHLPISQALEWPRRVPGSGRPIDWTTSHTWSFEPLDENIFPAVRLAKQVGVAGGTYPAVFNAANEQAVHAFHAGRIGYLDIVETITKVVDAHHAEGPFDRQTLMHAELWARQEAERFIVQRSHR